MLLEELVPETLVFSIKEKTVDLCKSCKGTGRQISLSSSNGVTDQAGSLNLILGTCPKCVPEFNFQVRCAIANVPHRFWNANLTDLGDAFRSENGEQLALIEKYISNLKDNLQKGIGLHFQGPHGVAKTFLGCIILQQALRTHRCYFSLLSDLVTLSFESRNNYEKKELLDDIIIRTNLLMIDEVDKVAISSGGQVVELVDSLFRKRYFEKKSVILTGNCLMEDIEKVFGSSVSSMLTETTYPIILTGEDFRKSLGDQLVL